MSLREKDQQPPLKFSQTASNIGGMIYLITCSNPNVFALNAETLQLAEKFCSCPAAKSLVDAVAALVTVLLETGPFPNPRTMTYGDTNTFVLNKIHIEFPQETPTKKIEQVISDLALELFNLKNFDQMKKHLEKAHAGELSVDEFAHNIEKVEFQSVENSDQIMKSCTKLWEIGEIPPKMKFTSENFYLWNSEAICHTDSIRKRWIDQFQKKRCEKHPEDLRSCQIKKSDLCDFTEVNSLPVEKHKEYLKKRYCQVLFQFPLELQKIFMRSVTKLGCSEQRTDL